ncbi:hypothetical protein LguiA_012853 [Lonicera macranthoides]
MRKKLDTRFPAARIKKIMQADEDVGKIAMAVPLLVSKALELFLQDLCDRTYEITLQRGAKTMNSLHLKQCVQSFNVFDFLRDIVSKVPDLGGSEATTGEDRCPVKRRKVSDEEDMDSDDESKKGRMHEIVHTSSTSVSRGRGRGSRGRGRGRGRGGRTGADRDSATAHHEKFEVDSDSPHSSNEKPKQNHHERITNGSNAVVDSKENIAAVRNFDLNVDLNENEDSAVEPEPTSSSTPKPILELKQDEYPGWSLADVERMAIDPIQIANLNSRMDEEEEDYDEEG